MSDSCKKIAIVGCGAMGSVYAALLASAGHDVLAVDGWQAHVDTIHREGLRLEGASGDRRVALRAVTQAPREAMDLVIVASKASQVPEAAHQVLPLLGSDTVVLTIQNGLGSADVLADAVGADRLAVGVAAAFGASLKAPGHAHHNGMAAVRMGAHAGLAPQRVEEVAALWRGAGFHAEAAANVLAMQWDKLVCNVAYSGPCALTGLTVGQAMDDADIGPVSRAAAAEALQVAHARGLLREITDAVAHVRAFGAKVPHAKPSVLQDLERGRVSEIDVINGAVPREAARCGLQAPVNATITALVKQRERSFGR